MSDIVSEDKSRNVILGVGIAGIAGNAFASGGYGFWDTIVGLLLFLALVEFWSFRQNSLSLRLAYAFAMSYLSIMITGIAFDMGFPFSPNQNGLTLSLWNLLIDDPLFFQFYRGLYIFIAWFSFGTFLFCFREWRSRR